MSDATDVVLRTAAGLGCVIGAGFGVTWLIGGLVGTRVGRRRDRRKPTTEVSGTESVAGIWDRDPGEEDVDPAALEANVLDNAPLPERTLTRVVLSGPDVWAWIRDTPDERARVGDAAVEYDLDLADHRVYYVHPDQTVIRNVTAEVNAWRLRQAEIAEVGTIADVQANEAAARMAQPEMTRQRPIGDQPEPADEPDPRRTELRAAARGWANVLGMEQADDRQAARVPQWPPVDGSGFGMARPDGGKP